MSKIAVIGPGAIGGTMAAWLMMDTRHEVCVAARTPFEKLEIETPQQRLFVSPRVITDPSLATPVDWVLIATKAYDAKAAEPWLRGFLRSNTFVAVLQNGVEHIDRYAPYVPVDQIVPVVVDCPAERLSPGRIRQRGTAYMLVQEGTPGKAFADLFSRTQVEVSQNADFMTQAWRKLCINSAGALSAILLKPSAISQREPIAEMMRGIVREGIAVGQAEGAKLDESLADYVVAAYRKAPPDSVNSLHADRMAGRPMEYDARNGVIVRLGRKHGIATPLNTMIVALLEAVQGD